MFGHSGKGVHHGHHGAHHPHDPLSVPAEVINSVDSGDLNRVFLTSGQLNSEAIVEVSGCGGVVVVIVGTCREAGM